MSKTVSLWERHDDSDLRYGLILRLEFGTLGKAALSDAVSDRRFSLTRTADIDRNQTR